MMKEDAIAARKELDEGDARIMNPSKAEAKGGSGSSSKSSAPSIGSAAANNNGDFSANFLNNLQTQYAALNGTITKTDEVKRQLALSSEKFTQSQKNEALSLAELIDQEKRRVTVEEAWKSTVKPFADKARDMQFEVSLIGKTAEEQARLRFEFELTNKVREQEIEIQRKVKKENLDAFEAATMMYEIERQAQETRIQYAKQAANEYDKQYDALRGLSEGMKDYWRSAERMGENTRNAVQNAFRGMEDAMVNFVKTGKLDFKSLADSIVSDLIRIQIQQSITGPLAKSMSAMFTSSSSTGQFESDINTSGFTKSANGNVMTDMGPMQLNKYANGGIATSPQISIFGEGRMNEAYVPLPDGRTIPVTMKGGGGSNINVQIINNNSQAQVSAQTDGQGGLTVLVDMVKNSMADDVFNGVGSMPRAMESRYGLRTAGA
jgi:lambda family phage tail tape measure protein